MTATLPEWMTTTGPIPLLPADDEFWADQPRDERGRWAPKERPLQYRHLVAPEPEPTPLRQLSTIPGVVLASYEGAAAAQRVRTVPKPGGGWRVVYADDPEWATLVAPAPRRRRAV